MKTLLSNWYKLGYKLDFLYRLLMIVGGENFAPRHIHPFSLFKFLFIQKVLRINGKAKWPVHHSSRVDCPEKIIPGTHCPGIGPWSFIDGTNGIIIGKNVRLAPRVSLLSINHNLYDYDIYEKSDPIVIGDNCWIGCNSVVLPGITLGNHTVVAAGSVVTKSFPEGNIIIGGVPAKFLKKINDYNS